MTCRPEILDKIMFYILKRAKCEKDTDKYLDHVLVYCKNNYQQTYKNQIGNELAIEEIQRKLEVKVRRINYLELSSANRE